MRHIFRGMFLLLLLMVAGCVSKGPYYIYGDYYEDSPEEELAAEQAEQD